MERRNAGLATIDLSSNGPNCIVAIFV